jgi:hypothetical protein
MTSLLSVSVKQIVQVSQLCKIIHENSFYSMLIKTVPRNLRLFFYQTISKILWHCHFIIHVDFTTLELSRFEESLILLL